MKGQLVLLVILVSVSCPNNVRSVDIGITDLFEVLRVGRETLYNALESWKLISSRIPGQEDLDFPFIRKMETELRNRISAVSLQINQLEYKLHIQMNEMLTKLLVDIPMQRRLEMNLREFSRYISQIEDLYDVFLMYVKSPGTYERYTLEDFARTCVSSNLGALPDILRTVYRLMVPSQETFYNNSILMLVTKQMQGNNVLRGSVCC